MSTLGKKSAVFALLLMSAAVFQGCTQDQVDAVGDAVIVAGAVIVAANTHCVAGYRQVCHTYTNYEGEQISECRQAWDNCAYTEVNDFMSSNAATASLNSVQELVTPVKWGDTFGISYDSAGQLIAAMKETQTGRIDQAQALGFTRGDLITLAKLKLPSEGSIETVARHLNANPDTTRRMLQELVSTMAQDRTETAQISP